MPKRPSKAVQQLGTYARAQELREASLESAQSAFGLAVEAVEWEDVASLREQTIPVFDALMRRVKDMAASAACEIWDAYVPDWTAELFVIEEPDRARHVVEAAARLVDAQTHECGAFVRELQTQLQLIYDEAKAVCFDAQTR